MKPCLHECSYFHTEHEHSVLSGKKLRPPGLPRPLWASQGVLACIMRLCSKENETPSQECTLCGLHLHCGTQMGFKPGVLGCPLLVTPLVFIMGVASSQEWKYNIYQKICVHNWCFTIKIKGHLAVQHSYNFRRAIFYWQCILTPQMDLQSFPLSLNVTTLFKW